MSSENIRQSQQREKSPILFARNQYKGNRLSLLSVYFQTAAYYDGLITNIFLPIQLVIFIYKYNILYYQSNVIAGQIILLGIGFFLNIWRLSLGKAGNKGKKYWSIGGYMLLTILMIVGFFYIVAIQANILWLEFIMFIIALIISITEFILMIVLAIFYRANQT